MDAVSYWVEVGDEIMDIGSVFILRGGEVVAGELKIGDCGPDLLGSVPSKE